MWSVSSGVHLAGEGDSPCVGIALALKVLSALAQVFLEEDGAGLCVGAQLVLPG